jgi:ribose/xylose/arabinose/galactoside ABC-type transport system permease subunit
VPGTLLAVFVLATGIKGVELMGAPLYAADFFNGAALIGAVALSTVFGQTDVRRFFRQHEQEEPEAVVATPHTVAEKAPV